MADKFAGGVQLPDVGGAGPTENADLGYIRLYARGNIVYGRMPDGTEVRLTNEEGAFPLFIQDAQPTSTYDKYMWIQTNYQVPGDFTIWFEDGE